MSEDGSSAADWGAVALIGACALLLGVGEVLFIPLYIGSTVIPIVVLMAIGGNFLLPRWAYATVHSAAAAVLPLAAWLLPVLALPLYPRAEGDVLVSGGGGQQWTFYGVVVLGCAAGFRTILKLTAPPPRQSPQPRPPQPRPPQPRPPGTGPRPPRRARR